MIPIFSSSLNRLHCNEDSPSRDSSFFQKGISPRSPEGGVWGGTRFCRCSRLIPNLEKTPCPLIRNRCDGFVRDTSYRKSVLTEYKDRDLRVVHRGFYRDRWTESIRYFGSYLGLGGRQPYLGKGQRSCPLCPKVGKGGSTVLYHPSQPHTPVLGDPNESGTVLEV